MNFAPYQDDSPETTRALSPPPRNAFSPPPRHNALSPGPQSPRKGVPPIGSPNLDGSGRGGGDLPSPGDFENNIGTLPQHNQRGGFGNGVGADERNLDVYSTSLPMRLDYEAAMAYLLLPPAGGAMLLIFEHKSDYVRFHAWQSSLLFTFLFVIHLIFSFSAVISYMLLAVDLILIAYLTLRALRDADTLDRCEVPFFGRLASSFVDDE